ncbi:MAG: hypothetical protein ABFS32_13755 [Bacteroidota bacterium]
MELKRINNFLVVFIILCSTSFYHFSVLGPVQKVAEFAGIGLIVALILFHIVYDDSKSIPRHFGGPIFLIILSIFTSMAMAIIFRNQSFGQTMMAQKALYFYLFYFLLHQLKVRPVDLEKIFMALGLFFVVLYLVQFILYPKIIFDAYIREARGTIRIYMAGGGYMTIAFFLTVQSFLRTTRIKSLVLVVIIFSIIVLNGGRQTMAIMSLMVVLFVLFDKKVKSKLFLVFLGTVGAFAIFLIFQGIFEALILQSQSDAGKGADYIRIRAANYYLTEFYKTPLAYITGNGAFLADSEYGKMIRQNALVYRFYLGDIGLIGNYIIYGVFFLIGVITINIRTLIIKIESQYIYIRYMFLAVIFSLLTSAAFSQPDYIVLFSCLFYIIDVSKSNLEQNLKTEEDIIKFK